MKGKFNKQTGLTLVELVTTVAIISILAGLALPAYDSYTRKGVRGAAKAELTKVSGLMETYYTNNKTCTSDLTNMGYSASPAYIDKAGNEEVAATSADRVYSITVTSCTANTRTYTLTAAPLQGQANDTECANLTLNSLGQRNASGPKGTKCW